jgi:hypothetical protein
MRRWLVYLIAALLMLGGTGLLGCGSSEKPKRSHHHQHYKKTKKKRVVVMSWKKS